MNERILVIEGHFFQEHMTVLSTGQGLIVVDTLTTAADTREALDTVRRFSREPVRMVVNTHLDIDHYGGNQCFPEAAIIGHPNGRRHFDYRMFDRPENRGDLEGFIEEIPSIVPGTDEAAEARRRRYVDDYGRMFRGFDDFKFTPPQIYVENGVIALGEMTVELKHLGPGHTDADLLVLVPGERTIMAGDLVLGEDFCPAGASIHGGSIKNFIRILKEIEALAGSYTRLIPGHGRETTPAAAAVERRYFERLADEVGRARTAGMTLEQAKASIDFPEYRALWNYEFAHPANIETAWPEV